MPKPVDFDNLRRVILLGSRDACRDAGLEHFLLDVDIQPAIVVKASGPTIEPLVKIEILELTPEEAARVDEADAKGGN